MKIFVSEQNVKSGQLDKIVKVLAEEFDQNQIWELAEDIYDGDVPLEEFTRNDLYYEVASWVYNGIKNKDWTLESWIKDVKEGYDF